MAKDYIRPLKLSDRILTTLLTQGPKSHPELAELLGTTLGCIRTSNTFNRDKSYIQPIGKSMNRAAGHVKYEITGDGEERLQQQTFFLAKEICRLGNKGSKI